VLIAAILALGVGTYTMRLSGVLLRDRLELSDSLQRLLPMAAAALLAALAATATLTEDGGFAGVARPVGVAVGAVLAAALLRLAGLQ
jgi:branched-subunit amino acid transport protein